MNRKSAWSTVLLLTLVGTTALAQASAPSTQPVSPAPAKKSVRYGQLPLSFEPNVGQSSHEVQWLSRGQDYTLFLSGPDAVLEVSRVAPDAKHGGAAKVDTTALRMNLLGGNLTSASTGEEPQTGKVNYFTGNNSADWHRNVSLFGRVRLRQVYPGIDLAYYGHQGQLEYDFIVAPEADASAIRLRFDGATPQLAGNGDLVLPVNGSEVRFHQPVVYQMQDGVRQPVDGRFTMAKNHEVTFALGAYDKSRELVIDPTLVYTGTFGTASESDAPAAMAVDAKGELIITGATYDLNFPATSGAYQTACGPVSATDTQNGVFRCAVGDQPGALSSAYIAKLSADGTSLVYATYLHGITGWEKGSAVQADAAGNAVVVGQTASADFPLVHAPAIAQMSLCQPHIPLAGGPPVQTCNGYFDGGGTEWTIQGPSGFVTKLSADGSTLLYSAFLGFSGTTYPQSLALDASGNMYILSEINDADPNPNTSNPDEVLYPTTSTAFQTGGVGDYGTAFTALSADGQTILYSTIYGETQPIDSGCGSCLNGTVPSDVAVGQNGIVFIAGETRVTTLPVSADAVQTTCLQSTPTQCANNVGYVAAFDITKSGPSSLAWATYISGPDNPNTAVSTQLNSIAADADNNVYVTGYTTDALFPTTAGAYATTCPLDGRSGANFCDNSVFISKLNSTGSAYTWSTFLAPTQGASSGGTSNAIAIDAHNNVYVYGDSGDLIIPAVSPLPQYPDNWYQPYPFVSVLNPTGTNLLFSSQIAPNNYVTSMQNGMTLDPAGNIYLVGNTQGQQTYFEGNTTLTSWPTTTGTYSTPFTGTGPVPFFVKISALLSPTATTLTATPNPAVTGQEVTFDAMVAGTLQTSPAPTGTVTLTNTAVSPAATIGTIDLSAGSGSFTTSSLAPGTYTVVGTYSSDSVYDVSTSSPVMLTINNPVTATIQLGNLSQTYTGAPLSATATTTPANLPVTITYNGSTTAPTAVGSYTVVATIVTGGAYTGTATGTLVISPATAGIILNNLSQTYTGSPLSVTATTTPANQPVTITYNGSTTAPTNAASYSVVATIVAGGDYSGSASGTLVISPSAQTISFAAIPAQTVGVTLALTATSTSKLTVSFSSTTPTICSVSGTTATMLATGTCTIQASQGGSTNFAAATAVDQSFTVNAAASDFKLIATPSSEAIKRGNLAVFLLEVQSLNSFSGSVKITCSGGPSDSVCADFPQTLKLSPNKTALAISGILFPKDTTPGTYTLSFTGTSGSTTSSTTAKFTVQE